jgi:hypothetical protein
MVDITVLVKSVLETHEEKDGGCEMCDVWATHQKKLEWPCPPYRIASDWLRQHQDLCRAWKNRTGKEVFLVRKFACAICSEKDTGLICAECIADAQHGDSNAVEEVAVLEDMANG